jgi:hypothetical protein
VHTVTGADDNDAQVLLEGVLFDLSGTSRVRTTSGTPYVLDCAAVGVRIQSGWPAASVRSYCASTDTYEA